MELQIPEQAAYILKKLNDAGYEAYVVGGCVRDAILGRTPNDWDITTSALPEQVKAVFRRTVDTGIKHGTVTVLLKEGAYEVTTYRIDGIYEDGRHPKDVTFTALLSEDLRRRDFTVNAMAYHPVGGLVDLFGGQEDLKNGVIRAVGEPSERFEEDALRILRALRFAAQLGFTVEAETLRAVAEFAPRLEMISRERIREELTKLLISDHPELLETARETGITARVLPEYDAIACIPQNNRFHCYTVERHTMEAVRSIAPEPVRRWTMLLHDIGKSRTHIADEKGDHFFGHAAVSADMAEQILRGLKFDNGTIDAVKTLVRYHDYAFSMDKAGVRRAMNKVGAELFPVYLEVMEADTMGKSEFAKKMLLPAVEQVRRSYEEILRDQECFTLKQLAIGGKDLIDIGILPGKIMGEILNRLLEEVLEDPKRNERGLLLARAKQLAEG